MRYDAVLRVCGFRQDSAVLRLAIADAARAATLGRTVDRAPSGCAAHFHSDDLPWRR